MYYRHPSQSTAYQSFTEMSDWSPVSGSRTANWGGVLWLCLRPEGGWRGRLLR